MLRGLVVLGVAASVAEAGPLRLEIRGDACDLGGLEAQVRQLAPDAEISGDATRRIAIETRMGDSGVVARITGDGEREVQAPSCSDLVESLALIVALAVPAAAEDAPTAQTDDEAPVPVERIDGAPLPSPPQTSTWSLHVGGTGARTSEGWITRAIGGVRWQRRAHSLGVELRASTPRDEYVTTDAKIRVWSASMALTPCLHVGALGLCTSVAAGFIHGASYGLDAARSRTSPALLLGGRLEWTHPVWGQLGVRLHLDGEAYLTTTRFTVDQMPRWSHDRVEVRGGFGAVAHFP